MIILSYCLSGSEAGAKKRRKKKREKKKKKNQKEKEEREEKEKLSPHVLSAEKIDEKCRNAEKVDDVPWGSWVLVQSPYITSTVLPRYDTTTVLPWAMTV